MPDEHAYSIVAEIAVVTTCETQNLVYTILDRNGVGVINHAAANHQPHDDKPGLGQRVPLLPDGKADVHAPDLEIQSFEGYFAPWYKTFLFYAIGVCTAGLSFLVAKWSARVHIFLSLSRCSLKDAEYVRITLVDGRVDLEKVDMLTIAADDSHPSTTLPEEEYGHENLLSWQTQQKHHLLEYHCQRYFYLDSVNSFVPVQAIPKNFPEQLQKAAFTLSSTSQAASLDDAEWDTADRQMRYGTNEMVIPVRPLPLIIFHEMWHPFYVFQYFSIVIWMAGDQYYSYSVCILLITWFSILTSAYETHSNMKRLANIAYFKSEVTALRGGHFVPLSSIELVPGDIVVVEAGTLPCDVVLLRGECIVDENMLTGESVPVRKVPYSPVADGLNYTPERCAQCTLYGGTMVAQARAARSQRVVGMVVRTRFYSAKGQLLRSILFPKEHSGTFVSDSLKFIAMMLAGAIIMYIWAAVTLVQMGAPWTRIVVRLFDMITIAVPPALPACLTIATVFSIQRLRKKGVFVTSPDKITMAGHLDVIAFDKTGTLTEQGLDLKGIVPALGGKFGAMTTSASELPSGAAELLASCHGLARLGSTLVGDPLDQKLFAATHWDLFDEQRPGSEGGAVATPRLVDEEDDELHHMRSWVCPPGGRERSFQILRRFEFSSALQRNVVLVKRPEGRNVVFAKGSPEMIRAMVQPDSVPADFDKVLMEYTREGYRVIALARADVNTMPEGRLLGLTQEELEGSAPFELVGLAVMANPLRPDTAGVIAQLVEANIRTLMVTGDHLRTAISVAHQCGILPDNRPIALVDGNDPNSTEPALKISLLSPDGGVHEGQLKATVVPRILTGELECAVTGKGFSRMVETYDTELLPAVLRCGRVFARMSPDNKRDLMELLGDGLEGLPGLPHLSLHAGFCGDGANDCGALKAAHVGVSLCEAEASVAAPMTSKHQSVASMITVVAEGRCTLMATYQIFQFIIGYAMVQCFSTNLMYTFALDLGNYQYLIQDLFYTTVLAALMGRTQPRTSLSRAKPLSRVMSAPLLVATLVQLLLVVMYQLVGLAALRQQPGYVPTVGSIDLKTVQSPENTVVYLLGLGQFIILALVFNKGHPHRRAMWSNISLMAALAGQVIFLLYSVFDAYSWFNLNIQQLMPNNGVITTDFRGLLVLLMVTNGAMAFLGEFLTQLGFMTAARRSARRSLAVQ